jgi:hypothetical protein
MLIPLLDAELLDLVERHGVADGSDALDDSTFIKKDHLVLAKEWLP